jgi:hypothetical protein
VNGRLGQADDGKARLALAGGGPVEGAALGVGINEQNAALPSSEGVGDVDGERRLADAAILVQERDDGHDSSDVMVDVRGRP